MLSGGIIEQDIDQAMQAFNVEEFVREYEKEILQRLSTAKDNLGS